MSSLILEIQQDALNKDVDVADILRKALAASIKLNVSNIEHWLKKELNGYKIDEQLPEYRTLHGRPVYLNPYNGWQPLIFADDKEWQIYSTTQTIQSVSEMDALVSSSGGKKVLGSPYPHNKQKSICRRLGFAAESCLEIPFTEIIGVLNSVRNSVLEWALELEKRGVLGEGMQFSDKEKANAQQAGVTNITNNIGTMNQSQLQQASNHSTQTYSQGLDNDTLVLFINQLKSNLDKLELIGAKASEVNSNVATIEAQLDCDSPNPVIVNESLKTIRNVLEGVTGSVIATGLLESLAVFTVALA